MASIALLVLPLSHFFVPGEQMTLRRTIGFLIGFGGVALLIGPEALAPVAVTWNSGGGCFACWQHPVMPFHRLSFVASPD